MTLATPPYCLQANTVSHSAQLFRNALSTLLGNAGGVVSGGDLAVTQQSVPNMSVLVAPGQVFVAGSSVGSFPNGASVQGLYYTEQTAASTQAISAADPTNPRIDTLIVQVEDAAYAGANNDVKLAVITGTPTAGATLGNLNGHGAVPASSLVLAYVLVPASATSIVTADISPVATVIPIGPLAVVSMASNATAASGQMVFASPGVTAGLPPASAGAFLRVVAANTVTGTSPVIVQSGSANIFGGGVSTAGVSSFPLGMGGASVDLVAAAGNWQIVAGQQDSGWVPFTYGNGASAYTTNGYPVAGSRLKGNEIKLRGAITVNGTNGTATITAAHRPNAGGLFRAGLVDIQNQVFITQDINAGVMTFSGAPAILGLGQVGYPAS